MHIHHFIKIANIYSANMFSFVFHQIILSPMFHLIGYYCFDLNFHLTTTYVPTYVCDTKLLIQYNIYYNSISQKLTVMYLFVIEINVLRKSKVKYVSFCSKISHDPRN